MDRKVVLGAALAVGAMLLVPGVPAAMARGLRPVVRRAARAGASALHDVRRAGAEVYEEFEDVAAEVRADFDARDAAEAAEPAREA
jgi:hypothetical protein